MLATTEIRQAKLRFGLLSGAVALLVFLVLLLATLSSGLLTALVGALRGLDAQGVVYSEQARDNLQASRLPRESVEQVLQVPGVASAAGVGTVTATAALPEGSGDLQIVGYEATGPGAPTGLSAGRLPDAPGEAAVDGGGVAIGDRVQVAGGGPQLTVVGLLRGSQLSALPTAFVLMPTFDDVVTSANPRLPFVPVNAVAFDVDPGQDPAAVAASVGAAVPGTRGYTIDQAVAGIPGLDSISTSFGILVGLTFLIGIVVIGFFFLILTVQKLRVFTLLRAIGTSSGRLAASVAGQIAMVVLAASVLAVVLTVAMVARLDTGIPVTLNPALVVGTVAAVLICSLLAGMLSIRRISRIDPSEAVR